MTIKQFIEKAIEGGYGGTSLVKKGCWTGIRTWTHELPDLDDQLHFMAMLLDPLAWQAVGRVEEWSEERTQMGYHIQWIPMWWAKMLGLVDALAVGKTIESYLKTL